jgi:cytidylate kinase
MPIVTVSRGAYSRGEEVAEKVAQKLGYGCVSQEVLIEASEEFNVPELKLLRAMRDGPSILDRFTFGKETYLAFVQAALLEHLQADNVVYHGLAGHYFVQGISHAIKIRIIGNREDRVKLLMQREQVFEQAAIAMTGIVKRGLTLPESHRGISEDRAKEILEEIDESRRQWGLHVHGVDTTDSNLYDLVIHLDRLSTDDAADIICLAAGLDRFQPTAESQQAIDNLLLASRVKASLIKRHPRVNVVANQGTVYVALEGGSPSDGEAIRDAVGQISGVSKIEIDLQPFATPD